MGGKFPKYNLNDKQIRGIANIVLHEQGTTEGWYAEASQIANRTDIKGDSYAKPENAVKTVISGWYANGSSRYRKGTDNKLVIEIVKRVFCEGYRTLPRYIDEHDYINDIESARNSIINIKNKKSKWKKHKTIIKNKMGSKYIFYDFPGGYDTGVDPFGYTSKDYRKKWGDFCYTVEGAQERIDDKVKETVLDLLSDKMYSGEFPTLPQSGCFMIGDGYKRHVSYGKQIKLVQSLVNWILDSKLIVDGMYGEETKRAVKKVQKKLDIIQDGIFGANTLRECKGYVKS